MYKRPLAYICKPKINTPIHINKANDYSRVIFDHGYTPIATNALFYSFINNNSIEERNEVAKMNRVLIRKSFIMFVCGDYIIDEMKQEMLYARQVGVTVVPLDGITRVTEYLKKGE